MRHEISWSVRIEHTLIVLALLSSLRECKKPAFENLDEKYHLVAQSHALADRLFYEGRVSYNSLKNKSLHVIDTFLDLVHILNEEMAREVRTALVKFYKLKYFHDFTNYAISMEEMTDLAEHCLVEPVDKLRQIRAQFRQVISNFQDVRNFHTVDKCADELPDEVAAAHCLLHQAVLFNETMQENLLSIVEIKTRQHAQDMNTTIFGVQRCLNSFVPKFFEQLLVDAYTPQCGYLKVVNASIVDLIRDDWRRNQTVFPAKWSPLVELLKDRSTQTSNDHRSDPLFITLFAANLSSVDIVTNLGSQLRNK